MKNLLTAIILGAALAITSHNTAYAETSYLDRLAVQLLQDNPALQAANHSLKAQELALKADNQLNAPEIEVEHLFGGKGQKDKTGVTVSQSIDWPGAYRARRRAIAANAEAAEKQMASLYREKLLEAKLLMLDIIYTRRELAILDSVSSNIDRLLAHTEEGFRRGELTILDVNRMRIERLTIHTKTSATALRHGALRSSLEALAGTTDVTDIWNSLNEFPSVIPADEEVYTRAVEENNPQITAARARAEAARAEAAAARMNSLPGFTIGYRFSREEGRNFHGFVAGMTLPFLKKNRIAESVLEESLSAGFDYQEARLKALSSVYSLHAEARRLFADNAEYRRIFDSTDNMRLLAMAYRGGELNSLEYLTSINYFLEGMMAYLESEYRQCVATERLNSLL